ncbi:hypothetical protein BASA50_011326 [Batrachochytrium salamandrivorans]|uniref:Coiled-coil domain-containing protein 130 n=1 Tax=Batrachochytrium salamandrivorans TaxID=1357716 RepID=A0ABQ8EWG3_9FUNG|nr:hypothetical protein BASA50_011326 [Batrachochytrium salamandrivorans]
MADRRATNKYYPPDWDPSKGSINTFVGQHPLRDRARKLDQGILIVRFELPYNIWCLHCNKHVGMGVRYNAEKKKVGMYFSTPIFSFRMKCHLCNGWIEIHTDPENTEYKIISGARKREEAYDPEDIGLILLQDKAVTEKLTDDPFYKLEHGELDKKRGAEAAPRITTLQDLSDQYWKDPYTLSQKVRKRFRTEKKVRETEASESKGIQLKHGFGFSVLPSSEADAISAKSIEWNNRNVETHEQKQLRVLSSRVFSKQRLKSGPRQEHVHNPSLSLTSADHIRAAVLKSQNLETLNAIPQKLASSHLVITGHTSSKISRKLVSPKDRLQSGQESHSTTTGPSLVTYASSDDEC